MPVTSHDRERQHCPNIFSLLQATILTNVLDPAETLRREHADVFCVQDERRFIKEYPSQPNIRVMGDECRKEVESVRGETFDS